MLMARSGQTVRRSVPLKPDSTPAGTVTLLQTPAYSMMCASPDKVTCTQCRAAAVVISSTNSVRGGGLLHNCSSCNLTAFATSVGVASKALVQPYGRKYPESRPAPQTVFHTHTHTNTKPNQTTSPTKGKTNAGPCRL